MSGKTEVAWEKGQNDNVIHNGQGITELAIKSSHPSDIEHERSATERLKNQYKRMRGISKKQLLVWISRLVPGVAAFICVILLIVLMATPSVWRTNADATDAEKLSRTTDRGQFVSIVIAILLNIIGAFMFYIKVREALVVTNYGFILGPVIGFLLDQGIGTDAGWSQGFTAKGFDYTMSSLIGGNFMRYIVTIFLDLFISNPLQDILKTQVVKLGVIEELKTGKKLNKWHAGYDAFVALNYPSILQSIVAFVTFNAYTNQTRFSWAYPSEDVDRAYRIPSGSIMLSTAVAGVLYLNFYTIMDYISERQYFDVNTKLMYVLAILGLLYGLNATDSIEAPVEGEDDVVWTESVEDYKWFLGTLLFTAFVLYGFVYPIWTRLGCCGKWKPKELGIEETDDHMAMTPHPKLAEAELRTLKITNEMLKQIKAEIKQELMKK